MRQSSLDVWCEPQEVEEEVEDVESCEDVGGDEQENERDAVETMNRCYYGIGKKLRYHKGSLYIFYYAVTWSDK